MTRDELIEIIEDEVYIEDNYGSYQEIAGISDAADAILAKLELEKKIAFSCDTIELLTPPGVAL